MLKTFLAALCLCLLPALVSQTPAAPIDGDWAGALSVNTLKLRVVIKLATTADGLSASLQSPDQSPQWIKASNAKLKDNELSLGFTQINATYSGKLSADQTQFEGYFMQNGATIPLTLTLVTSATQLERKRPQMPEAPFPYTSENLNYSSGDNVLAATLTLPKGKGPFPAVILICGSGPHDRDETLMGHKPFLVLADALTRRGIAVLRTDKRGVGRSTGNYATATTADFADDAEAGLNYLLRRQEIDAKRIGLLGHSEGGDIAPMVAARNANVAFVIMLAGPAIPGDQLIVEQTRALALASGVERQVADKSADTEAKLVAIVKAEQPAAVRDKALHDALTAYGLSGEKLEANLKVLTSPWYVEFLRYDPASNLAKLQVPLLALYGEKDLQVPPAVNAPALKKILDAAGGKQYVMVVYPGLNHLFQTAKTGLPSEYGEIEETIAPEVLKKIGDWVLAHK
jgi:pimeloyl-ACP methyl ester carboxylesterase